MCPSHRVLCWNGNAEWERNCGRQFETDYLVVAHSDQLRRLDDLSLSPLPSCLLPLLTFFPLYSPPLLFSVLWGRKNPTSDLVFQTLQPWENKYFKLPTLQYAILVGWAKTHKILGGGKRWYLNSVLGCKTCIQHRFIIFLWYSFF